MKSALLTAALAAVLATPAFAQPPTTTEQGVIVQGVSPEKVLGAIDTEKLAQDQGAAPPVEAADEAADLPSSKTQVTVDTTVEQTQTATVETTTETITPVSDRPAMDFDNPIAPEVHALVKAKPNYTTKDIAEAQLAAVLATPASAPTTTVTTTPTTPRDGG
jgi:hypothetical protein